MWSPSRAKPLPPTNRRIDLNKERRISEPQCLVLCIVSALVAASDHKNTRIYQANLSAGLDEQRGLAEYVPRLVLRLPRFLWSHDTLQENVRRSRCALNG